MNGVIWYDKSTGEVLKQWQSRDAVRLSATVNGDMW